MGMASNPIICDGCGLPASPEHIAERVGRLELATRFRPIHINTLFVALAPMDGVQNDFYAPPIARDFFDSMMEATEIDEATKQSAESSSEAGGHQNSPAKLIEFQRRGYYIAYLSECPLLKDADTANAAVQRLSANLIRRIRFNYKPKQIALFGSSLSPLIEILNNVELGPIMQIDRGQRLAVPEASGLTSSAAARSGS
jgi:hypothetical protein